MEIPENARYIYIFRGVSGAELFLKIKDKKVLIFNQDDKRWKVWSGLARFKKTWLDNYEQEKKQIGEEYEYLLNVFEFFETEKELFKKLTKEII